ncbi:hypothetical protein [Salipiger pallidus]|uniref:hypothetical protein n=1 Tax=Salipiger pallidus TaxID=1775170 RepID=UPI001668A6AB|nr:hypothetical protein [Salipiger pallidus]
MAFAEGSKGLAPQNAGAHIKTMSEQQSIAVSALREFRMYHVSMALQSCGLAPSRTALQNIICGLTVRVRAKGEAKEPGMRRIETLGVEGYEDKSPQELSGSMCQRVGLARAPCA